MAQMWPRRIPLAIRRDPLRSTECRFFDALQRQLADAWVVFYSRPWLGLSPTGEEIDGEADFILAHPERGILCLEVKGGAIDFDPRTDEWTSQDRHKIIRTIKNPVAQARSAKYRIIEKLRESPHWAPRRIRIRHGVVFPGTIVPDRSLGPDRPRKLFMDRHQFTSDLPGWIELRLGQPEQEEGNDLLPLGRDGVRALTKLLAEPFHLHVPLGHLLDDDDHEIEVLTHRQFAVLSAISPMPRVAVHGGAGTGKTVLAIEVARRDAERRQKTLFTCFNRALANRIAAQVGDAFDVRSFHSLCGWAAQQAGISAPPGVSMRELHESCLPDMLFDAATRLPDLRYDAIVVDEGQDFRRHWWAALEAVLRPGGRLTVFHDSNQKLYVQADSIPQEVSASPIALNQNLRNTDAIHFATMKHYEGETTVPNGVSGSPVEWIETADPEALRSRLLHTVRRLIEVERVAPDQIAVLCAKEDQCRQLAPDGILHKYPAVRCDEPVEGAISLDTIRRFKGLDARAVILIATPDLASEPELSYVAISRARTHLTVIGDQNSLAVIRSGGLSRIQ